MLIRPTSRRTLACVSRRGDQDARSGVTNMLSLACPVSSTRIAAAADLCRGSLMAVLALVFAARPRLGVFSDDICISRRFLASIPKPTRVHLHFCRFGPSVPIHHACGRWIGVAKGGHVRPPFCGHGTMAGSCRAGWQSCPFCRGAVAVLAGGGGGCANGRSIKKISSWGL